MSEAVNNAPELIEAWLRGQGRMKWWLAQEVGVDNSTLSRWLGRSNRPGEAHRTKLHELCGVHPDAWGRG